MNLKNTPYYLGLDCGTNSVGFAVTDKQYNLLNAYHKDLWGSHLFSEAETAKNRRLYRNARKRLNRRKDRIDLLQSIFAEEIYKIDKTFFLRLNESALWLEDRSEKNAQKFTLFNDPNFTDKKYNKLFPTTYHLRVALIDGTAPHDPRLVYLACHHILKSRGHFLFPGENMASVNDVSSVLRALKESFNEVFAENNLSCDDAKIQEALQIQRKKEREEKLNEILISSNDSKKKLLVKAMVGYKVDLVKLFETDEYGELPKLEFAKTSFEEQDLPVLESSLSPDEFKLIESLKALYDWALLADILSGHSYISKAKVAQYDKNKEDLKKLKRVVKKYAESEYANFFYSKEKGFSRYIGSINSYNKTSDSGRIKRVKAEDFYKEVKDVLKSANQDDPDVKAILEDIENEKFFVLLRYYGNSVVPYQVNFTELKVILKNASEYMPWLKVEDDTGLTAEKKILEIMKFRIPYYVGSLTDPSKNKNAWIVKKDAGKIYPWNFEAKVDVAASAEKFITRMTNKCTYLPKKDVLPKHSLLYERFNVLNEINNLKFNEEDISVEQKQVIYNKLFKQERRVTPKRIKELAIAEGWCRKGEELRLSGIDIAIKSSLNSYHDFKEYLDSGRLTEREVDNIIKWLTLFSDGGSIVRDKIKEEYGNKLSDNEIEKISRMKFSDWGNLSREFLAELEAQNPETGEITNIITLLWETNDNLMEIIHNKQYGILEQLNNKEPVSDLTYDLLDDLRISPKVRRQLWQALRIVKEIENVMGHKPEKVFIEVTRGEGEKGKRTKSRKEDLLEKLKEDAEMLAKLNEFDESVISKRDRLYLYFTQRGKCMYSGDPIDLDDLLGNQNVFDIDHIIPFSKSNDDSLANKVIVKKTLNSGKSNRYPVANDIQSKMKPFWKGLLDKELISSEKYQRLTRNTPLSEEDIQGFINRQLVETSQSTKALAELLQRYYGDETRVVYSKGKNVSDFRRDFELPKSRSVNHLHHAKDAYLNIVVGNTYHTKYSTKFFLRNPNFNDPFKRDVEGAWVAKGEESLKIVRKTMSKNTVLFTRQPEMRTGQLFDVNPKAKGSEKGMIPLKETALLKERLKNSDDKAAVINAWTDKYGGYNSLAISHFALIKYLDRRKYVFRFIPIPVIRVSELLCSENLIKYCVDELKLNNVEVIRSKVLINTLVSINGFKMTISGRSGDMVIMYSAIPLYLSDKDTAYVKRLEKFLKEKKQDKNKQIKEFDGITYEDNVNLYKILLAKSKLSLYKDRPASQLGVLEEGASVFESLSIEDQTSVLLNIINYLGMDSGQADLKLIKGSPNSGKLRISSKIDLEKISFSIVDQSITGIFEKKTEFKL